MKPLKIMVTRHSSFYAPVICAIRGGFLEKEGLAAEYIVGSPDLATEGLVDGSIDIAQSAVSASWAERERGEDLPLRHFATINRRDGFFLIARDEAASFTGEDLAGKAVLADHGRQPLVMLRYAAKKAGWDISQSELLDAGGPQDIEEAFRSGSGDFAHLQGPAPQLLAHHGHGKVLASLGEVSGAVAFSSLRATTNFLSGEAAQSFTRAFSEARRWVATRSAEDVAGLLSEAFADVPTPVLIETVGIYQQIGSWGGDTAIDEESYAAAHQAFTDVGALTREHPISGVVSAPPGLSVE